MKFPATLIVVLPLTLFLAGPASSAHKDNVPEPDESERCPVCRMYVNVAPEWLAVASTEDGRNFYFDGPKDLFRFVFETEKYLPGKEKVEVKWLYVTEYYTLKLEPASTVFFILGSNVYGPMGHELVPVRGRAKAEEFMSDHRGREILSFADITPELVSELK
jgi:nitrous oxide reductase accessory protein NosL